MAQVKVSCLIVAECSVPHLVGGDTKRGWGKHLSKGLLLIEGREHVFSLALVIFHYASASLQVPWQELLHYWR